MSTGAVVTGGNSPYIVSSGQIDTNDIVESGGLEEVSASGTTIDTVIDSSGVETVSSGGTATSTTISGGTLELESGSLVTGGIAFAGSGGLLQVDGITMPSAVISGFAPGDTIDLTACLSPRAAAPCSAPVAW